MRSFVIKSSTNTQINDEIEVEPFRLNIDSENSPTEFETIFIHQNVLFRYGFEVNKKRVVAEWLYHKANTKEVEVFYRDEKNFESHKDFKKGKKIMSDGLVRNNALLLSVSAQFNEYISIDIIEWFKKLRVISGLNERGYNGYTINKSKDKLYKQRILELLQAADIGIDDINLQKIDVEDLLKDMPKDIPKELKDTIMKDIRDGSASIEDNVLTTHKKYNANKEVVNNEIFSLDEDESAGTRKFFAISGPILDVLENGYTLIVDELDSKLHPNLVCKIVSLFNSREINAKNAQLIFNTHDTNLLSSGLFRRDQIWFTQKNKYGEANLYSLADFKTSEVRKNESFEENYIKGKYGAVPYLGFFDYLNNNFLPNEKTR